MKNPSPGDVRNLRSRKKKKTEEKKISTHENKGMKKFKLIIAWVIIIAFIGTSGIIIAGMGMGNREKRDKQNPQKPLGEMEKAKKRLEYEVKRWNEAIKKDPGNPQNYFNLAQVYHRAGKTKEAVKNYNKALELDPKHTLSMKYLADLYAKDDKMDKAEELLKKAVEINPKDDKAYSSLALLEMKRKNLKGSIDYISKAIKAAPGEVEYYSILSDFQLMHSRELGKKGDKKMAEKWKKTAKKTLKEGIEIARARRGRKFRRLEGFLQYKLKSMDAPIRKKNDKKKTGKGKDANKVDENKDAGKKSGKSDTDKDGKEKPEKTTAPAEKNTPSPK